MATQAILWQARASSDKELVTIVDKNNNIIDYQPRKVMRKNNLYHRASYILIFMKQYNDKLLVQKRVCTKDYLPGYFDLATGGVVNKTETPESNAYKELEEELGIKKDDIELTRHSTFLYTDNRAKVFGTLWICYFGGDINDIAIQKTEVESIHLKSIEEILDEYNNKNVNYTPDSIYSLNHYLKSKSKQGILTKAIVFGTSAILSSFIFINRSKK